MSKIIEHNIETGEITERDMTEEELAQQAAEIEAKAQVEANAQAQVAARQAILDRLGLSEEEARLLLG